MSTSTECALLKSEFQKYSNQLSAVMDAPVRMLNTISGMVTKAALSELQTTQAMFDSMAKGLGLDTIEDVLDEISDGLQALKNCASAISTSSAITSAISADVAALTGIQAATQLPGLTREKAVSQIRQNALTALGKGMSAMGLGGSAGSLTMRYSQMLKSAGITDSLNAMNGIVGCLSQLCGSVDSFNGVISKDQTSLKIDASGTVQNLWENASSQAQSAINNTVAMGNKIQNRVNAWC